MKRAFALLLTVAPTALFAQTLPTQYKNIDDNGVDLTDGSFNLSLVEGSIGAGESAIAVERYWGASGWTDNWQGMYLVFAGGTQATATVVLGDRSEKFLKQNGVFVPLQGNGATLAWVTDDQLYRYRDRNGGTIDFSATNADEQSPNLCMVVGQSNCTVLAIRRSDPNGRIEAFGWDVRTKSC